ncbi:glycosyltransferase [Halosolutus halophilus]|uniref:glycosyltransferase n=1 Tax=Halosolutus halophilus TaxID=1552990 RepID=UPI0022352BDB|nr:glycosyltransferase [Halosolutus halophilus]
MQNVVLEDKTIEAYVSDIDDQQRQKIREVAEELTNVRVAHVNSTASGGGVAEIVQSLVPLLNDVGVETDWLVMDATAEFFDVTKAIHNGLQGEQSEFTDDMRETYRPVTVENAEALGETYDVIVLHDPQTLGMAPTLAERFPETAFVWRCHIDLTAAAPAFLEFLQSYLDPIDRAVFTLPEYGESITGVEKVVVHPAIDPFTEKNRPLEELSGEAAEAADPERYPFDTDRPLIVQISRFDPWKDPLGVVDAYRDVTETIPDTQLALVGSRPDDDPEGIVVYREVEEATSDDPDVHLLSDLPDAGINALQRGADVVLQKSLREGFALTVAEALWKETPVVGSNVGGIPLQIEDGANGYLVEPDDIAATADRVTRLLDDERNRQFGERGRETIRERFLLPRLVSDYLTLIADVSRPSVEP